MGALLFLVNDAPADLTMVLPMPVIFSALIPLLVLDKKIRDILINPLSTKT
jgi:hypothetical protein